MKIYEYGGTSPIGDNLRLIVAANCEYFLVFEDGYVDVNRCSKGEYLSPGWIEIKDGEMEEVFYILSLL